MTRELSDDLKAAVDAARIEAARRQRLHPPAPLPRPTWRDVARVCLPGWVISRPFAATANLLLRVGPDIATRLERLVDRPEPVSGRGRGAGMLRVAAIWLLQSPNDARPAIPEESGDAVSFVSTRGPVPATDQGSSVSAQTEA